ncbi:MAG: family 14 glycosylhydrolase [Deltaproteobacteria bacterium]|nr:family 14 glycosylhydrolase [Deltaproteobacteria bacterium]
MEMIAQTKKMTGRDIILHFTDVEMDDCANTTSMAKTLVLRISEAASDHGIAHKAENALECVDEGDGCGRRWQHITNVFKSSTYSGFTLLRLPLSDTGCWHGTERQDYANFISAFKDQQSSINP